MAALLCAGVWAGCSLTQLDRSDCVNSDECREVFGMGYVCASDGICELSEAPARVVATYPTDLLERPEAYGDNVVLGVIVDYSLETHRMRADSVLMAAEGANDPDPAGIVLSDGSNREVAVVITTNEEGFSADGLSQEDASAVLAGQLADLYGARSIIGPPSSSATEAVYLALGDRDDAERPVLISMSATSNSLTDVELDVEGTDFVPDDTMPGLLWRTAPPDVAQAARILESLDGITGRGITRLAIVYEEGPYGAGLATAVNDAFVAGGGTVELNTFFTSDLTRTDALGSAGGTMAEEVLFVSSQTSDAAAAVVFANSSANYNGTTLSKSLFLTDAAANSDLLAGTTGATAYYPMVRGTRPAAPSGQVYDTFAGGFDGRREMGEGDADSYTFIAHSYDAAWLAIYASAWALSQEPEFTGRAVARGLRRVSDPTTNVADVRTITWPTINGWMRDGESFDVTGASGDLDYDPVTEETTGIIEGWCPLAAGPIIDGTCPINTP